MDLYRFHVPLLLIAPGIQDSFGATEDRVGSQVDIVPTIMGRLPGAVRHQCWGRDLLSLPASDPGFAIIKPSGSDQTVAMLSGEHILVLPKGGPARGYQYRLGREAQALPLTTPTQEQRLGQQLQAYLQTATSSLLGNTTGVVDNNAMPQGANVAELSSKLAPVRGK